jgi:voltage-gated potassium channel
MVMAEGGNQFRKKAHAALDPASEGGRLSLLNLLLTIIIVASVAFALLETEETLVRGRERFFDATEIVIGVIFLIEYLARLYTSPELRPHLPAWKARLRWIVSPFALVDLAALLPLFFVGQAAPSAVLRLIRLLRIIRLAKLGRMSRALTLVVDVFSSRRFELGVTGALGGMLLILVATLLYLAEGQVQPEKFGSIPRALWWGVITLTTIGYGDVYPITALGKVLAGFTAVLGIGLVAAPTGILASGFAEALREQREGKDHSSDS